MSDGPQLSPTLWRTCRTLANRHRLGLVGALIEKPYQSVSELAGRLGMSLSAASQSLRALNARGLLRAERRGRTVCYEVVADPSVPGTQGLVSGLQQTFAREQKPVESLFRQITAFTHPRRVALVALLRQRPHTLPELQRQTGISSRALHRHLAKLTARGVLMKSASIYSLASPATPMAEALLRMT